MGLKARALDFSPITGPEGNIEYLVFGEKIEGFTGSKDLELDENVADGLSNQGLAERDVKSIVNNAHRDLYRK